MSRKSLGAIILSLILLLPGCTSLNGNVQEENIEQVDEILNCQDDPSQSGCLVKISSDDCSSNEIFDIPSNL